jgi:hypothetical protein
MSVGLPQHTIGEKVYSECFGASDSHMVTCQIVKLSPCGLLAVLRCPDDSHPDFTVEL